MKYLTAVLVAMGVSTVAFAAPMDDPTQLPAGESAYGYSMSDPYTDGTIVVQEYILVPADTVVLIPLGDDESTSHVPG